MHRPSFPRVLYVTDLHYNSPGRDYCAEDAALMEDLSRRFAIEPCDPRAAAARSRDYDLTVVRNSGPVIHYEDAWREFRMQAETWGWRVYNALTGRGDMAGKQYLLDMTNAGMPVIPTVESVEQLSLLPSSEGYVVKPKSGADSIGMSTVSKEDIIEFTAEAPIIIQPKVEFHYEVSFYFVDADFIYALHAPEPTRRWDLAPYQPRPADLAFAQQFIEWNALDRGIQRVDACRTISGELLLVELEDLNPFLSLDCVTTPVRERFIDAFSGALSAALET